MQCSWVKRLFEDDCHDSKVILLFLIGKHLGKDFKFHNNIDISNNILSKDETMKQLCTFFNCLKVMGSTEIYTIKQSYFSDKNATECCLWILGLKYE